MNTRLAPQRGLALIVALILLLVMTMVAVVAMRSTTLDLKMTTNTALNRRAFQNSEAVRTLIGPILEAHSAERAWPAFLGGGMPDAEFAVDSLTNFTASEYGITSTDPEDMPANGNFKLCDLTDADCANFAERSVTPDFRFFADEDADGVLDPEDVRADVWITKTGLVSTASGNYAAAYSGGGGSSVSRYYVYHIRSVGRAPGNAEVTTTAEFRVRDY